jgi:hypothetical protein
LVLHTNHSVLTADEQRQAMVVEAQAVVQAGLNNLFNKE